MKVRQIFNLVEDTGEGFKNPQRGRIYDIRGLAPSCYCFEGGGLETKILIYEESNAPDMGNV